MSNLRYRLLGIALLTAVAAWALFTRNRTVRQRGPDGVVRETVERHVPLRYGLDLQGGMHLALEVDDSKGVVADKSEAIDRALKTVRNRIEGFGVSEPVIQKSGSDRIIVELPGISDQDRALSVVRSQALLEFKITDKTQALERVLPRLDAIIKEKGLAPASTGTTGTQAPSAPKSLQGLLTNADSGKKADTSKKVAAKAAAKKDSSRSDTTIAGGGALSNVIQQGSLPGEYFVELNNVRVVTDFFEDTSVKAALPPAKEVLWGVDSTAIGGKWYKRFYVVDSRPIITGEYLTDARPNTSPLEGTIVQFKMSNVGGRRFRMFKFRTMRMGADDEKHKLAHLNHTGDHRLFKIPNDPRTTRLGRVLRRWSLDELPQLVNVLLGDMSLIGPRPFFESDFAAYEDHHFRRLDAKPGITGLWQVSGRSDLVDFEDVIFLDRQYIEQWSFWLDVSILFRTIPAVLRRTGAF